MKAGDLVVSHDMDNLGGIIIEIINDLEVPPVARVLWQDGTILKVWSDDLEVISESR